MPTLPSSPVCGRVSPPIHLLARLAQALEDRVPTLAEPETLDYYTALLRMHQSFGAPTQGKLLNYVQRVPLGVVAQITPFNHPLLIAVEKIAPALAAGNSIIMKPSGILSVLPVPGSTTGKELVSHPLVRKVDITAGTATGRALGAIVGGNLAGFTAELGGKAPIVIFDNVDVPSVVNGAAFSSFVASGKTCVCGIRLLVQSGIYNAFVTQFLEKVKSITERMGDRAILMGGEPLEDRSSLRRIRLLTGQFLPADGDHRRMMPYMMEGRLGSVRTGGGRPAKLIENEGVELADDSQYGLAASIWTRNLSRAHQVAAQLQSGLVWVNTHHRNDPSSPWGGMKESGIGRENGTSAAILRFTISHHHTDSRSSSGNSTHEHDDRFGDDVENKRYG
ncbi:Aldehyde/histidinol dehydrogenase [Lactifluus subvellereus]|nr:Aldehyde/histidinol dehydrogenase [Lactifluus subvellereus]